MRSGMMAAVAAMAMMSAQGRQTEELFGTAGVNEIARRQREAERRRREGLVTKKRAAAALVSLSSQQLVLGHVHPRWLRHQVERLLDAGEPVTFGLVEQLREAGMQAALEAVDQRLESKA